jgi:hypothetical protein
MGAHAAAAAQDATTQDYIRSVAASDGSSAAENLTKLADLRDRGVITGAEFQQGKAKALAG